MGRSEGGKGDVFRVGGEGDSFVNSSGCDAMLICVFGMDVDVQEQGG